MDSVSPKKITVSVKINSSLENVWKHWTDVDSIKQWNNASEEWHTPSASNDLNKGGKFSYRMEARDGSFGFDFSGKYNEVISLDFITYTLDDGRKVDVKFIHDHGQTEVIEVFEAEQTNPIEMQRQGWQAILDNFKRFCELKKQ